MQMQGAAHLKPKEVCGHFCGVCNHVGDKLTFKIWDPKTQKMHTTSSVWPADTRHGGFSNLCVAFLEEEEDKQEDVKQEETSDSDSDDNDDKKVASPD